MEQKIYPGDISRDQLEIVLPKLATGIGRLHVLRKDSVVPPVRTGDMRLTPQHCPFREGRRGSLCGVGEPPSLPVFESIFDRQRFASYVS